MASTFDVVWMILVLVVMFCLLLSDLVFPDHVMIFALTLLLTAQLITVEEALAGFANAGLLTVLTLFVVAAGISHTGGLDWYMSKLLGHPSTLATTQLRLMLPIALVSAFLNNTPVVAVMIPIVQRWSKSIQVPVPQLLMPLSFASILGGTCTLIGTSTNLVVAGLLEQRYLNTPNPPTIGLFDLSLYGVPVLLVGLSYILLFSPLLLPGAASPNSTSDSHPATAEEVTSLLFAARVTPYSPVCAKTVESSGLRGLPHLYLVAIHVKSTNVTHRAIDPTIVLAAGDRLEFEGNVEEFGQVCEDYALTAVTNENDDEKATDDDIAETFAETVGQENCDDLTPNLDCNKPNPTINTIGLSTSSHMASDRESRVAAIAHLRSLIRTSGMSSDARSHSGSGSPLRRQPSTNLSMLNTLAPPSVVVASDPTTPKKNVVLVGVNAPDRQGLLHDISKGLARLSCNAMHTEASVVGLRSVSIWRCEVGGGLRAERRKRYGVDEGDVEEIFSVMHALLHADEGAQATKKKGLRVIRCRVRNHSRLVGRTAEEARFRLIYRAAVVAVQRNNKTLPTSLQTVKFETGDMLLLQVGDDSILLTKEFNDRQKDVGSDGLLPPTPQTPGSTDDSTPRRWSSMLSSRDGVDSAVDSAAGIDLTQVSASVTSFDAEEQAESVDLLVQDVCVLTPMSFDANLFDHEADFQGKEFLTAMYVKNGSKLAGKTLAESGIRKLPGVHLFSIERPVAGEAEEEEGAVDAGGGKNNLETLSDDEKLNDGDIVWFCGSGEAIMELRKIPGLSQMENEEVKKLGGNNQRRLVQGVVARKGPLVGKSIKELKFRTRFQCVVIAVHREGTRVTRQIGEIVLHAGDVLLLEASPSFLKNNGDNARCFALLSEIKDSAPPRLKLLIPALLLAAAMLAVYTAGLAPLITTALLASAGMVLIGILTQQEARDAINWDIYVTIAAAFGIGTAMVNSGVAGGIASGLTRVADSLNMGDAGLFAMIYLATVLISNVVTNNAAAALVFPIAIDAAERSGISVVKMSYNLMLAASASFSSPFGYQTNLMVYGPGGYKFLDFIKFGGPMQVVLWIWTVVILSSEMSEFLFWGVGGGILLLSAVGRWRWELRARGLGEA